MSTSRLMALCCAATFAIAAPAASALDVGVGVAAGTGNHSGQHAFNDRTCLRETGSRIHRRSRAPVADADVAPDGKVNRRGDCGMGPGRSYSREDILMTGHIDLADALRALDPSIR